MDVLYKYFISFSLGVAFYLIASNGYLGKYIQEKAKDLVSDNSKLIKFFFVFSLLYYSISMAIDSNLFQEVKDFFSIHCDSENEGQNNLPSNTSDSNLTKQNKSNNF